MTFTETILKGSYVIEPIPWGDNRGWFTRTYCKKEFAQIGHNSEWVQMNHSFSSKQGTIRGMHYQKHPHSEIKMVRCIAGAVIDVIVDLRNDSETFLMNFSVELSFISEAYYKFIESITAVNFHDVPEYRFAPYFYHWLWPGICFFRDPCSQASGKNHYFHVYWGIK